MKTSKFTERLKGLVMFIAGLCLACFGYWIGFVGFVSARTAYYVEKTTYPIGGIVLLAFGALLLIAGLVMIASPGEKEKKGPLEA